MGQRNGIIKRGNSLGIVLAFQAGQPLLCVFLTVFLKPRLTGAICSASGQ